MVGDKMSKEVVGGRGRGGGKRRERVRKGGRRRGDESDNCEEVRQKAVNFNLQICKYHIKNQSTV